MLVAFSSLDCSLSRPVDPILEVDSPISVESRKPGIARSKRKS
jgi:hypothetical protein